MQSEQFNYFAQVVSSKDVAQAFGWPAAIVILGLVAALIFTVRQLLKVYSERDALQERRVAEAKETQATVQLFLEKLLDGSGKQRELSEKMYDILLKIPTRGN